MKPHTQHLATAALPFVMVCACFSCTTGDGRAIQQAQAAEQRGQAHVAYDYYAQAARERPRDSTAAAGIKRHAPTAANYWSLQAHQAASEGRHDEAWTMAMRSLQIRPDQQNVIDLVRQLEQRQPTAIAGAQRDWQRTGRVTVDAEATRELSTVDREAALAQAESRRSRDDTRVAERPPPTESVRREPPDRRATATPEPTRRETDARESIDANGAASEFVVMHVLSRKDKRHPERRRLADGIYLKVKDVNGDRTVDVDLDDGSDRVQKIREMRVGQSKLFRGRSGRWYRFTLLEAKPNSETIRISVMPG